MNYEEIDHRRNHRCG